MKKLICFMNWLMKCNANKYFLFSFLILSLSGCDKENFVEGENSTIIEKSKIDDYVDFFIDVAIEKDTKLYHPKRWKNGGIKGTDSIDIFFHESFKNAQYIDYLKRFVSTVDSIIEDETVSFNFVESIEQADIVIVKGRSVFETLFETKISYGANTWGAARIQTDNSDYNNIISAKVWVDRYDDILLNHEFLHCLGFKHTYREYQYMNPTIGYNPNELTDLNRKMIYLLYHDGSFGKVTYPMVGDSSYTEQVENIDEYKNIIKTVLNKRFGF